ncbi:MAG: HNH endonuclease [Planctomycetota bacterium]|nr:MAG: HNH endonuclease [Planctomycetota bacterium]
MAREERISEPELILPALYVIRQRNGVTTSQLINELATLMKPSGEDLKILSGRTDTKFSQKVRNLVAHFTLEKPGYVTYDRSSPNNLHEITDKGLQYLHENINVVEYLLSNDFLYDNVISSFIDVAEATKQKRKILSFDENLLIAEGTRKTCNVVLYKRSVKLRNIAIQHYTVDGRIKCCACNFDYYDFYGDLGSGFIEIHHVKPVVQYEDEDKQLFWRHALQNVTPACSNCHRMIHRRVQAPLDIDELKALIAAHGGWPMK